MNCNTPTDITFSFRGFSQRAGVTDQHTDGWGIAFFEGMSTTENQEKQNKPITDKGLRLFIDHHAASNSPVADLIRHYPIKSRNVVAHIRKATQGVVALQNCHPFVRELWGHYWVFAHNGNLENYYPALHSHFHPVGSTDSERAFCWLMQEISKAHACMPSMDELTRTLRELMPQIACYGVFNMLLSNGTGLWAHASTHLHYLIRQNPFSMAALSDEDMEVNFADLAKSHDRVAIIATQPLTHNEQWIALASDSLTAFADGAPMLAV